MWVFALFLLWATAVCARDVDPYKILDVSRRANDGEIKKAYRKLSLRYHPDKQHGKSEEEQALAASMFLKIKEAYELLSDDTHRALLDDAVAGTMRAQRAHAERTARMDASTKRFRDDLERREQATSSAHPLEVRRQ